MITRPRPGPRHIGYVALSTSRDTEGIVWLAFTTSQLWTGPKPSGVYGVDRDAAAGMGQSRPFTLDLRRLANVPVTAEWFPDLEAPAHGIVGRAPERLRLVYEAAIIELARRNPQNIERLGPRLPDGETDYDVAGVVRIGWDFRSNSGTRCRWAVLPNNFDQIVWLALLWCAPPVAETHGFAVIEPDTLNQ